MEIYEYTKDLVDIEQLLIQINANAEIGQLSSRITLEGNDDLKIYFEDELTSEEQTTLQEVVNVHTASEFGEKKYLVKEYDGRLLKKEIWYNKDNGDGTYDEIVEEKEYFYEGIRIIGYKITIYWINGLIHSQEEYEYYVQDGGEIVIIKQV